MYDNFFLSFINETLIKCRC